MPPPPKTVLFDADGVVQQTPPGWEAELHATLGSPPEAERLLRDAVHRRAAGAGRRPRLHRGRPREVLGRWGLADRTDAVLAFWTRLELDQEVTALIRELRAGGAACWLATNQHELRRAYMSTSLGLRRAARRPAVLLRPRGGQARPGLLHRAVAQIGCDPGAALFIDDREPNVLGARTRRAAGRGLPPLLRRRRAARHPGGARPAVSAGQQDARLGWVRDGRAALGGWLAQVHRRGRAQSSTPSRRAERARWRVARSRRSRLTSIGSASSAAGLSIRVLSTW